MSDDDRFRQNLDAVTRALGERAAQHPDPVAEAMARRIRVQSELEARERRTKLLMGGTAAAVASLAVTLGILYVAWPPERRPAVVTQAVAEARPVAVEPKVAAAAAPPVPTAPAPAEQAAAAAPLSTAPAPPEPAAAAPPMSAAAALPESAAPAPPEPPQQVAAVEAQPAPQPAPQIASKAAAPPDPQPEPQATPMPVAPRASLARDEVREMQKRLLDFGFDPGPVDGNAGRLTQAALVRYQQQRGQPQSGPDRDALEQLRQDPAPKVEPPPQVAQRPAWRSGNRNALPPPSSSPSSSAPSRRSSGNSALEFLRSADANLSRWLNGLSH